MCRMKRRENPPFELFANKEVIRVNWIFAGRRHGKEIAHKRLRKQLNTDSMGAAASAVQLVEIS